MTLYNKFYIAKTVKTQAKIFKDLKVGQIVEISTEISAERKASGYTQYVPTVKINDQETQMRTLEKEIQRGFEFVEFKMPMMEEG